MMRLQIVKFLAFIFLAICPGVQGQTLKNKAVSKDSYPATFTVKKKEFDNLFSYRLNEPITEKSNKYLNKAVPLMNTKNGDMKFLKLKLDYFKNAFMLVQVNGVYSTQVFIMSEDKSVFYKGHFEKENLVMSKCSEDDIVTE